MKCENLKINKFKKVSSENAVLKFFDAKNSGVTFSKTILNLKMGEIVMITAKNGKNINVAEVSNIPYVAAKKMGKKIIAKTLKLENGKMGVAVAVLNIKSKK